MILTRAPSNQEIFKYRQWNDYTRELLEASSLFFACPNDFNDPFDTKVTPEAVGSDTDWLSWFIRVLPKKRMKGATQEEVELQARQFIETGCHKDPVFLAERREEMKERQSKVGIVSLAQGRDNLVMWAHYADSHKGLCIGVRIPAASTLVPFHVHYADRPVLNMHSRDYEDRVVRDCLLTKSCDWKYEDECRLIIPDFHGSKTIPRDWITTVTLGCKMSCSDRDEVIPLIRKTNPQAKLLQAIPSEAAFKLDFEVVDE